jgi:tetratricopeptide (TPR) repeat protein
MDGPDQVMQRINEGIALQQAGENAAARDCFEQIWAEIGPDGDPLHRCTLAHFMADAQESPEAKLQWDQRALAAADSLTDERAQAYHGSLQVRAFYPSLHLNLAQDHFQLGNRAAARDQIERARGVLHVLGDDGYGNLVRTAVDRLDAALKAPAGGRG